MNKYQNQNIINAHNRAAVLNAWELRGGKGGDGSDPFENPMRALSSNIHSHLHTKSAYYFRGFMDSQNQSMNSGQHVQSAREVECRWTSEKR